MNILHTLAGPALVGTIADGLLQVGRIFERGPDAPLNYATEFKAEHARARQREMALPAPKTPGPAGPSL